MNTKNTGLLVDMFCLICLNGNTMCTAIHGYTNIYLNVLTRHVY
jgi:hypothetical protein